MMPMRPMRKTVRLSAAFCAACVFTLAAGLCRGDTPASQPAGGPFGLPGSGGGDTTGLLWEMLATAMVILAIGAVAIYAMKRLLPRIRGAAGKRISVLETTYLGQRKAVHLLQVGTRKLLVASSPEGVVKLDDMTGAFAGDYDEVARSVGARAPFDEQPTDEAAP